MHRTSVRKANVQYEDENQTRGKNEVSATPRRALGNMKNMTTPESSLKGPTTIQKPGLQLVSTNLVSSAARARNPKKSYAAPSTALDFDIEEDVIEECNLKEDIKIEKIMFEENSVILNDQENEADYMKKLLSTDGNGNGPDTEDEEEEVETCGLEDDVFDYGRIMDNADSNAVLTDDYPSFLYERPDMTGLDKVKKYTLQEMEDLFDSFEVLIS